MQNYITSFSALKSSQFINDRLSWDESSPHRHDCHDPPHGVRVGFLEYRSPPRRLAAVARSDPWKVTRAQARFPGDVTRRRRLSWVAGPDRWNTGTGKDCLRRDRRGEDCHPKQEICPFAGLRASRIALAASRLLPGSGGFGQLLRQGKNQLLVLLVQLPEGLNELTFSGGRRSPCLHGESFRFLIAFKE